MLQLILKAAGGPAIHALGLATADLPQLLAGELCLTQLAEPVAAGPVLLLAADSHEDMVAAIEEAGFNVSLVIDQRRPASGDLN